MPAACPVSLASPRPRIFAASNGRPISRDCRIASTESLAAPVIVGPSLQCPVPFRPFAGRSVRFCPQLSLHPLRSWLRSLNPQPPFLTDKQNPPLHPRAGTAAFHATNHARIALPSKSCLKKKAIFTASEGCSSERTRTACSSCVSSRARRPGSVVPARRAPNGFLSPRRLSFAAPSRKLRS